MIIRQKMYFTKNIKYIKQNRRYRKNDIIERKKEYIQGVSEIRVLILTTGRTRQFMKLSL
jgi:hypothetical protein